MADTIVVVTEVPVTVEVSGPQGPQGTAGQGVATGGTTGQVLKKRSGTDYDTEWGAAASGSGTVTSLALAGTGLSITGSPVTTSGTILANVSYGTTAGTSTEGNDARIATIGSATINTSNIGGVINLSDEGGSIIATGVGSGSINLSGATGGSSFIAAGGSILANAGYGFADGNAGAGGTLDMRGENATEEIDGRDAGSISTRGTGSIGLGYSGTRTTLVGSAATTDKTVTLPNATGTVALTQQATDIEITDPTKGYILNSATKRWRLTIDDNGVLLRTALTLLFSLSFMCGAQAQVRDLVYGTNNVVIGPTNTNALSFTNSVAFSNPLTFGTNAATTRTNLGVTVASNLPAPYSGAAATNSLLVADGSGSSAFVSTIPKLTIASGTITNTNPALTISQTWSNSAITFTGLLVNITNTNSAVASLLADFQVGGTSMFRIGRDGSLNGPLAANLSILARGTTAASFDANNMYINRTLDMSGFQITGASSLVMNSGSGNPTVILLNDAAGVLGQRNGTNPQTYNIYNTYSNSTNYERGFMRWSNNILQIGSEVGTGGGTARSFTLVSSDGVEQFRILAQGVNIRSGGGYQFASSGVLSADVGLYRDGTGSIGQFSGTNAMTHNIYGSYTNSTNYRRLSVGMSNSGIAFIRPESAGPLATNNLIYISGLPTNSTGLPSGVLWNSNGSVVVSP